MHPNLFKIIFILIQYHISLVTIQLYCFASDSTLNILFYISPSRQNDLLICQLLLVICLKSDIFKQNQQIIIIICRQGSRMSQVQNPKRKLQKILENLSIQLDTTGLSQRIDIKLTNDPWSDLQNIHQNILTYLLTSDHDNNENNLAQLTKSNELIILDCLRFFMNIHLEMAKFAKLLYEGNYPLELYKCYRKLYEEISVTSNCLYQYQSQDVDFVRQKEELITRNLTICEEIQGSQYPDYNQKQKQFGTNYGNKVQSNARKQLQQKQSQLQSFVQSLKKQNQLLNDMIRQNDEQFTQQIQRYNNTLYDMQQTIRQYEVRLDKVREYETMIDDLQRKVIRLKEEKYRDDMLIDNMSKKIRYYEKERGGIDVFLSPRANQSRKQVMSPSRVFNNSLLGGGFSVIEKSKNYFGERLTTN